jgi:hypothetical protein
LVFHKILSQIILVGHTWLQAMQIGGCIADLVMVLTQVRKSVYPGIDSTATLMQTEGQVAGIAG